MPPERAVNYCRWREDLGPRVRFFDSLVHGFGTVLAAGFAASVRTPVEEKIGVVTAAGIHRTIKAIRKIGGTRSASGPVTPDSLWLAGGNSATLGKGCKIGTWRILRLLMFFSGNKRRRCGQRRAPLTISQVQKIGQADIFRTETKQFPIRLSDIPSSVSIIGPNRWAS